MDTALHITISRAGDPEKLGELVKAAFEAADKPARMVVPAGYRCVECYRDDGGHDSGCSIAIQTKMQATEGVGDASS